MKELLAELDAENAAAQSKSSKSSRKKNKKKGLPEAPRVRNRCPRLFSFLLLLILLLLLQHSRPIRSDLGTFPAQLQESCNDCQ